MSKNKILILKFLRLQGKKSAVDIAKHFCGDNRYGYMDWYKRLASLQTDGHVNFCGGHLPACDVEITPLGEDALELDQKSKHEKRVEWIRYIVTTIIALAAFIKSFFF